MSRLDDVIHDLYFELNCEDGGVVFTPIKETVFESYYAQKRLYLIRNRGTGFLYLAKGKSPIDALDVALGINLREE